MPQIEPFRPLRYNLDLIPDAGAVIAPPYDVISEEKRQQLISRDPHNIIRLILPEGEGQEKYAHAGNVLKEWISDAVLILEDFPALFAYSETFAHPLTGASVERTGILAAVRLAEFSEGTILPHERTLSGPKADRLALMLTTNANLEPIFGVYREKSDTSAMLKSWTKTTPWLKATDSDGVQHKLWKVEDSAEVDAFKAALLTNQIFIVDGHHRYETALKYRALMREKNPPAPENAPFEFIMMLLTPTSDPGLVILPTHRVIHSLPSFNFDNLIARLRKAFEIQETTGDDAGLGKLEASAESPSFLLISGPRAVLAVLRDPEKLGLDPALPEQVRKLDVTVLHDYILDGLLGISRERQAEQTNLKYIKSALEALEAANDAANQLVVMMNATRLEQVESVAAAGNVMPQKSTYFYPKLASGLLINPLWK